MKSAVSPYCSRRWLVVATVAMTLVFLFGMTGTAFAGGGWPPPTVIPTPTITSTNPESPLNWWDDVLALNFTIPSIMVDDNRDAEGWELDVQVSPGVDWVQDADSVNSRSFSVDFTSVDPGDTVTFRVRGYELDGGRGGRSRDYGAWSNSFVVVVNPLPAAIRPQAAPEVTVPAVVNDPSVTASWNALEFASAYQYRLNDGAWKTSGLDRSVKIDGLALGANYIEVRGIGTGGPGPVGAATTTYVVVDPASTTVETISAPSLSVWRPAPGRSFFIRSTIIPKHPTAAVSAIAVIQKKGSDGLYRTFKRLNMPVVANNPVTHSIIRAKTSLPYGYYRVRAVGIGTPVAMSPWLAFAVK